MTKKSDSEALSNDVRHDGDPSAKLRWYYSIGVVHTRVRVFMNGGNCGDLCFRNDEFAKIRANSHGLIQFVNETPVEHYCGILTDNL